jgi:predicted nucleotidyltransferase component of viral defense system
VKVFVPMLAAHAGIRDQDLLEKDVRLHFLLGELERDKSLSPTLIFKGGTCLIKCYLDYPRFSTDLDFTWRRERAWESLGTQALRRTLRPVQRALLDGLVRHAAVQGLELEPDRDVQYGQSNRMMTVLFHYESIARLPSIVKVQVNFAEPLLYATKSVEAQSLLKPPLPRAMRLLDSDLPSRYAKPVRVEAYDPREILAEKGRAILTRTAAKTRDLLDMYLLEQRLGLRLEDHTEDVLTKTRRSVAQAGRYKAQLDAVADRFELLLKEDVTPLLLKPLDDAAFQDYRGRAVDILSRLAERVRPRRRA